MLQLSVPQTKIYTSKSRFKVLSAGRRFGKSKLALAHLHRAAWYDLATGKPAHKRNCWYLGPTILQSKEIMWRDLREFYPPKFVSHIDNKMLSVELINGSRITCRGSTEPDQLRGSDVHFLVMDEAASFQYPEEVWAAVRPLLSAVNGFMFIVSSPLGYNSFYDFFRRGTDPEMPDWQSFSFTTADGGFVPNEELEEAMRSMSPKHFRQEYLASFEAMTGIIYDSFDPAFNVTSEAVDDGTSPLYVGMDFNISPMVSCVSRKTIDGKLLTFDEIVLFGESQTASMCKEIEKKYAGRKIIACPDAAGRQRSTSSTNTDFKIIKDFGFTVPLKIMETGNPPIADRITEVNSVLCNARGERRAFINGKCKTLIDSLSKHTYREGTTEPEKESGLDHAADAYGYKVHYLFPLSDKFLRPRVRNVAAV